MAKWSIAVLVVAGLFALVGIAYLVTSCPSVPLHYRAFQGSRSAPLDCFPEVATGEAPGTGTSVAATMEDPVELPFDLSGTWAQQEMTTTWANVPFIGDVETVMVNTVRVEAVQNGHLLEATAEVCGLDSVGTTSATRTIIPDAFVRAIGTSGRRAVVVPVDGGFRYRQERYTRVMGVHLVNPETDPLPDDQDDPRVFDDDQDGHPGVTVQVEGLVDGEIYLVQRHWKELCGDILSEDHIQGYVLWGTDQEVVDASNFMLNRNPTTYIDPDWESNRFDMRRIDPTMTCEEIMENQAAIFGTPQTSVADP